MDRAQTISGVGHLVLILWLLVGDWFWRPSDTPPMEAVSVSMVSETEFQAMQDAAPKADKPAETPAVKPVKRPEVKAPDPVMPDLPAAEPLPEPAKPAAEPAPAPDVPPEMPVAPDPQPVEAPPPVAPVAEVAQPIPVPTIDKKPKPRPVDRVAAVPVENSTPTPEIADQPTPEVTDQPSPDAQVVEEETPAASPEEATTQIVTEENVAEDAPQLAPTSSPRPRSRPEKPVEQPAEDTAPADTQTAENTEAAAVADALAAAMAETTPQDTPADTATDGGAQDVPEGPPMSASEVEGLRLAINQCWSIGTLSSEAMRVTVTLRVEMQENGKPDSASITMVDYSGGSEAAAQQAFEAGRRAVIRCAKEGYDLDPAKYGQWNVLNLVFDPSGMRLR